MYSTATVGDDMTLDSEEEAILFTQFSLLTGRLELGWL